MRAVLETEWTDGCAGEWATPVAPQNPDEETLQRLAALPVLRRRTEEKFVLLKTIGAEVVLAKAKPALSGPFKVRFSGDPVSFWM